MIFLLNPRERHEFFLQERIFLSSIYQNNLSWDAAVCFCLTTSRLKSFLFFCRLCTCFTPWRLSAMISLSLPWKRFAK